MGWIRMVSGETTGEVCLVMSVVEKFKIIV